MSKQLLILSDLHIPWHDTRVIKQALNLARCKHDIDEVHLLGDFVDLYQLSSHHRHPAFKGQLGQALITARHLLENLVDSWSNVIYHEGNHEERGWKYLHTQAEELFDIEEVSVPGLLGLKKLGIKWRSILEPLDLGPVVLTHGTTCSKVLGANARRALLDFGKSVIVGHSHRISCVIKRFPDGRIVRAYENGCLCHIRPRPFNAYTKGKTDWHQGFSVLTLDGPTFHLDQHLYHKGRFMRC